MTFNKGQGYPVVYAADTSIMLNGANPQLEGKITGATESNGVVIAKAQMEAAHRGAEGGTPPTSIPVPAKPFPFQKWSLCAVSRHGTSS
jgi:methyl-accepting chemotaxis protein